MLFRHVKKQILFPGSLSRPECRVRVKHCYAECNHSQHFAVDLPPEPHNHAKLSVSLFQESGN